MHSIRKDMEEFRGQLGKGAIQEAYRGLLRYMLGLRTRFQNGYPDFGVSGFYQGTMDMSYFALFPPALKDRHLKIAIVFKYDAFRFEAWLSGRNRQIQRQYWTLFRGSRWPEYRVVAPAKGIDSIVEVDLAEGLDLAAPDALTSRIEKTTIAFIADIERYLSEHQPGEQAQPRRSAAGRRK